MPKRRCQTLLFSADDSFDRDVLDSGFHCHRRCLHNDSIIHLTNFALAKEGHRHCYRGDTKPVGSDKHDFGERRH